MWKLLSLLCAGVLPFVCGCKDKKGELAPQEPPAVFVATPIEQSFPETFEFPGETKPVQRIDLQAQVSGKVLAVNFRDGEEVKPGQELYRIDDLQYKAALAEAKEQVKGLLAQRDKAKADWDALEMLKTSIGKAASESERRKAQADYEKAVAAVGASEERVKTAQQDLDWCIIRSPIEAQVDRTYIDKDNVVKGNAGGGTLMTTIVYVKEMHIYFNIDDRTISSIRERIRTGALAVKSIEDIPVYAILVGGRVYGTTDETKGQIDFIAPQADIGTGTRLMRAKFKNPFAKEKLRELIAGEFLFVRLELGESKPRVLIQDRAVLAGQGDLRYVYIVSKDKKVEQRIVQIGPTRDGLRVIHEGVRPGDQVIVTGMQQVSLDQVVNPKVVNMKTLREP